VAAYHRPNDLQQALTLLAAGHLTVAAGCTDLFPATQAKALPGDTLDITAIPALRGITQDAAGHRIGAATTWADILRADLPPAFDGLKLAAAEVGSPQIQSTGTLAGNLCTASPAGDGAPCLLTLNASVEIRSANATRVLPLQDFLQGPRQTALRPGEMLTGLLIPPATGQGHFLKLGARKYLVISIAMVATRLTVEAGHITEAAIAVGSCSPTATRIRSLESALIGQSISSITVPPNLVAPHLAPIDDIRADKAYRITAAVELIRRSLATYAKTKVAA